MDEREEIKDEFVTFGEAAEIVGSLYDRLGAQIAEHDEIIDLLYANPARAKRVPITLFAAVHDLVLAEPDLALAQWYASVVAEPRTDDAFGTFAALCHDRADDLRTTIATRSVQTNEVARAAFLAPPIRRVSGEVGPVSLLDIGTSAGLNLFVDKYRVDYTSGVSIGPADSSVAIRCETLGDTPDLGPEPIVSGRLGLDSSPIDPSDEVGSRWLKACVWPFQIERFKRLQAALALAATQPAPIMTADAIDGLADGVAAAATHGHPIIMHSWVMNYLPLDRQEAFTAAIEKLGEAQDLSWISVESPHLTFGLPFSEDSPHQLDTTVVLTRWRDGECSRELISWGHGHGNWLGWANELVGQGTGQAH